jgi:hypothetical protein
VAANSVKPAVVSAGNGNKNDSNPVDATTQSPARVAEALTVGATDIYDNRASAALLELQHERGLRRA